MREIKFRGKRVDNDQWIHGYYTVFTYEKEGGDYPVDRTAHYIMEKKGDDLQREEDDPKEIFGHTVGQYTGLKDKNGKEIYEGDILGAAFPTMWRFKDHGKVSFFEDCGGFVVEGKPHRNQYYETLTCDVAETCMIIGNVHEHAHLLTNHPA